MKHLASYLLAAIFLPISIAHAQANVVDQVITVEHGDYIAGGDGYGYCRNANSYQNEKALTVAAATAIAAKIGLTGIWGAITVAALSQLFQQEIRSAGGSIKEWLEGFGVVQSFAACGNVTLAVPSGTQIVGVQAFGADAANNWQMLPCFPPDGNGRYVCKIGWSEWTWSQSGRVVTGIFANWSGDRTRRARLAVTYTGSSGTSDTCLNGTWREQYENPLSWTFNLNGDVLTIRRTDGFVSGTFSKSGGGWVGQLHWGNGDTWNNIVLTPNADCSQVNTNQSWWYRR